MIITHMGNGIVTFDNALVIDDNNLQKFINSVEATGQAKLRGQLDELLETWKTV